jgi:hypothetical protein
MTVNSVGVCRGTFGEAWATDSSVEATSRPNTKSTTAARKIEIPAWKHQTNSISRWMPRLLVPLGRDGFGPALHDFFEVDARSIALAADGLGRGMFFCSPLNSMRISLAT